MIVDFHAHTTESDGSLPPAALVELMHRRGVEVFAISDHDTLSAYEGLGVPREMRLIPGVEINTTYKHNEVHVLGYGMRAHDERFAALLRRNREQRRLRVERMVAQLRAAGYGVTMDDVEREAAGAKALGRPHVGKALVRRGHFPDIAAAFRGALRRGTAGYVPSTHCSPQEAIEAIVGAGGIPVLAHPGRLKDRSLIDELAARGLRGLEVFYPLHAPDDVAFFRETARRLGLLATGGSDFHDPQYHPSGVGIEVPVEEIRPFLEALGAAA